MLQHNTGKHKILTILLLPLTSEHTRGKSTIGFLQYCHFPFVWFIMANTNESISIHLSLWNGAWLGSASTWIKHDLGTALHCSEQPEGRTRYKIQMQQMNTNIFPWHRWFGLNNLKLYSLPAPCYSVFYWEFLNIPCLCKVMERGSGFNSLPQIEGKTLNC